MRQDISRVYQVVQEPGTLNFVKSKMAVDQNMKVNLMKMDNLKVRENFIFIIMICMKANL